VQIFLSHTVVSEQYQYNFWSVRLMTHKTFLAGLLLHSLVVQKCCALCDHTKCSCIKIRNVQSWDVCYTSVSQTTANKLNSQKALTSNNSYYLHTTQMCQVT